MPYHRGLREAILADRVPGLELCNLTLAPSMKTLTTGTVAFHIKGGVAGDQAFADGVVKDDPKRLQ